MPIRMLLNIPSLSIIFLLGTAVGFFGPSIHERLAALEQTMEACCLTTHRDYDTEEHLEEFVSIKKRLGDTERELEEIRAVLGLRR